MVIAYSSRERLAVTDRPLANSKMPSSHTPSVKNIVMWAKKSMQRTFDHGFGTFSRND